MTARTITDLKIQSLRLSIRDIENKFAGHREEAEHVLAILETYEDCLVRTSTKVSTDFVEIVAMNKAISDSRDALTWLHLNQPVLMAGWYHGIVPANEALALANLMSRVILELTEVATAFEDKYPQLLEALGAWEAKQFKDEADRSE